MLLKDIIKQINRLISNNSSYNLNFEKLEFYIDGAVDHINNILKTNFQTPREYFESNAINEIISYYDAYLGIVSTPLTFTDVYPDGSLYYLMSENPDITSGYYMKLDGEFKLITDIYQMVRYMQFQDLNINSYINEYNYTVIPDKYIRNIIVYYAAALYLEEEDELENQYAIYKDKAERSLEQWQQLDFSVYDISESNRRFL